MISTQPTDLPGRPPAGRDGALRAETVGAVAARAGLRIADEFRSGHRYFAELVHP